MAVKLNAAERKTVLLAMKALSFREIAEAMETTEQVVKNRMNQVYEKTGAGGRVELVMMALAHPEWIGGRSCGECGRWCE